MFCYAHTLSIYSSTHVALIITIAVQDVQNEVFLLIKHTVFTHIWQFHIKAIHSSMQSLENVNDISYAWLPLNTYYWA